jgi:competence protein ComEA
MQSARIHVRHITARQGFWRALLIGMALIAACQADDLLELRDCKLAKTDWADGDSFLVRSAERGEFTVRLYGADCMEWHVTDPTDERRLREQRRYFGITDAREDNLASIELAKGFGEAAGNEVASVLSKPFTVHTAFADARGDGKHQRSYGFVVTSDGQDLAAYLVSKGLARAIGVARVTYDGRSQDEYKEHLRDLELQAASQGLGIWAETNWDSLPDERRQQRDEDREAKLAFDDRNFKDGEKLNPNTAARDDLMRLPGIGEALANGIIEGRPYKRLEDLLRVPRIGPDTLEKLKPHLDLPTAD